MSATAEEYRFVPPEREPDADHREVVQAFNRVGYPLHPQVQSMLLEEEGVFKGRKGSGFTQLTRKLLTGMAYYELFDESVRGRLEDLYYADENMDAERPKQQWDFIEVEKLKEAAAMLSQPDSKMIGDFIVQKYEPYEPTSEDTVLRVSPEKIHVGACTTAETYYLDFVNDPINYRYTGGETAAMNVITDSEGNPTMLEKEGIGDSYSCLTLVPLVYGPFKLPAGALLAVKYPGTAESQDRINLAREKSHSKEISMDECEFRVLRMTTLCVPPKDRARVFSSHFEFQRRNGMKGFDTTSLEDVRARVDRMFMDKDGLASANDDTW